MERHKAGKAEQYFAQHRNEYGKNIICSNRHKVRQMAIKGNIVGNGFVIQVADLRTCDERVFI